MHKTLIAAICLLLAGCSDPLHALYRPAALNLTEFIGKPFYTLTEVLGPPSKERQTQAGTEYLWVKEREMSYAVFAAGDRSYNGRGITPSPDNDSLKATQRCMVIAKVNKQGMIMDTDALVQPTPVCREFLTKLANYKK